MKCLSWNCRGRRKHGFRSNFNFMCSSLYLDLFGLMETKMDVNKVPSRCGRWFDTMFSCPPSSRVECLYVCCGTFPKFVNVITFNACFIHWLVKDLYNDIGSLLTLVYVFPQNNYNLPLGMIFLDLILTMTLGVSWDILIISLDLVRKKAVTK